MARYRAALPGSPAAEYVKKRGVLPDSWTCSVLGWSGNGIAPSGHPKDRLVIAYVSPAGVVSLKFRAIDDSQPKYMYAPGAAHLLFNTPALLDNDGTVVVTEGELDALIVQQHTGIPAVAYPGVSAWKPWMSRAFGGIDEVVIVADGDEVGREAAKAVSTEIGRFADRVRVVRMPDGEDSNSVFLAHGADYLKGLLVDA